MARVMVEECESCGRRKGEKHKATEKTPSIRALTEMSMEGIAQATDGCDTEPDGRCAHGHSSWLLVLGYI